ncbi:hypothetical protein BCR34DRAFT_214 [Clohesyomyces aquaticus]|uniref:Uncharacterized protein n=1 Tax=Clohesyomyces aquaticus TaxID=1231657 RepID=A0A1Y2ABK1_9PLEO|nr:hypothetical protein BCR34DRAFT_214 [Clohesyomyces aquaticus]
MSAANTIIYFPRVAEVKRLYGPGIKTNKTHSPFPVSKPKAQLSVRARVRACVRASSPTFCLQPSRVKFGGTGRVWDGISSFCPLGNACMSYPAEKNTGNSQREGLDELLEWMQGPSARCDGMGIIRLRKDFVPWTDGHEPLMCSLDFCWTATSYRMESCSSAFARRCIGRRLNSCVLLF